MAQPVIGFLGSGQMARALAGGFVHAGLISGENIIAFDPSETAIGAFCDQVSGARSAASNPAVMDAADVAILAVKPHLIQRVGQEVEGKLDSDTLLVSIAAGVTLGSLMETFNTQRIIRVMPNTPSLVGCGAAGYSLGPGATLEDSELVDRLLGSVGIAYQVEERLLDAVTGLSGSGPAFAYTIIEALSDGGVRMGLPRDTATALAAQTVLGAAKMVQDCGEHPAVLRDRVTSPGGTTIAGIQVLEDRGLRAALIESVASATRRSIELRQQ